MSNEHRLRCEALVRTCRRCKHVFVSTEKLAPRNCPDCGEDRRCTRYVVSGYRFCEYHGGPNPRAGYYGKGNGLTGSGKGSTFPLTRLAAQYNSMAKNGKLLSNRAAIEVIDTRVMELAERIDLNEAPDRLQNLYKLWKKFMHARFHGEELEVLKLQRDIEAEFEAAYTDYAAWSQMFDALDLRRKMVESEVKIAKDLRAIWTAEQVYELMAQIFAAIMRHVQDPMLLQRLQYEFTRISGDGAVVDAERRERETDDEAGPDRVDQEEFLHPRDEE